MNREQEEEEEKDGKVKSFKGLIVWQKAMALIMDNDFGIIEDDSFKWTEFYPDTSKN